MIVYPDVLRSTIVKWDKDGRVASFDCSIKFSEAVILLSLNLVVVFVASNMREDGVASVYNLNGRYLYKISYPEQHGMNCNIETSYKWSSVIERGIKIVFGTNSISYRDFWCDYDLIERKYVATNWAR